jgi:phosphoribosylglycinamide formyltransferase 1
VEPAFRFGVLASGGGSNLQSLIDAYNAGHLVARPVLVISNNSKAFALERARQHGIPVLHLSSATHPDARELDRTILRSLEEYGAECVVLAGYMKKLGSGVLSRYRNRIFNIHPAILPDFGGVGMYGMHVHRAVIESGATTSGPTVHLVNEEYDEGPILAQRQIDVLPDDTPEILQQRVLEAEHSIYPETLDAVARKIIAIYDADTLVRPISLHRDFDAAAAVVRAGFQTPAQRFGLTRENCPAHPSFADGARLLKIQESGGTFFCAFRTNGIVGCVGVEGSRDQPGTWYLEKLVVLAECRSTGLGALLLDHGCHAIREFGGTKVSIGLIDHDEELKAWYGKRGFVQTHTRTFDHLPFTVCFMARDLK